MKEINKATKVEREIPMFVALNQFVKRLLNGLQCASWRITYESRPSIGWVILHVPCDSENAQLLVQVDGQVLRRED